MRPEELQWSPSATPLAQQPPPLQSALVPLTPQGAIQQHAHAQSLAAAAHEQHFAEHEVHMQMHLATTLSQPPPFQFYPAYYPAEGVYIMPQLPPIPTGLPPLFNPMHSSAAIAAAYAAGAQSVTVSTNSYLPMPSVPSPMTYAPRRMPPGYTDPRSLFCFPGRGVRPQRIVLFLRGLPGAGKSRLASMLHAHEDRCEEMIASGEAGPRRTRVIALDDFFMVKGDDGQKTYAREEVMVPWHRTACAIELRRSLSSRPNTTEYESLVIIDETNLIVPELVVYLKAIKAASRAAPSVFVVDVHNDAIPNWVDICADRNLHNWTREQVHAMRRMYEPSPQDLPRIDYASLLECIQPAEPKGAARQDVLQTAGPLSPTPPSAIVASAGNADSNDTSAGGASAAGPSGGGAEPSGGPRGGTNGRAVPVARADAREVRQRSSSPDPDRPLKSARATEE